MPSYPPPQPLGEGTSRRGEDRAPEACHLAWPVSWVSLAFDLRVSPLPRGFISLTLFFFTAVPGSLA